MNFTNLISNNIGLAHLLFSILALLFGTIVLVSSKGSSFHKKIGYLYSFSMLGVLVTAFMIYRLFRGFGIFHWMAIVSAITLLGGMIPILLKRPKSYVSLHFNFMYWSVIGLYAAFVSETLVRIPSVVIESGIPNSTFYNMTGVGVALTMGLGVFFYLKNKKIWNSFDPSQSKD